MKRVANRVSRYLPLVLWMIFISVASASEFSSENTSRFIRPFILWLFPNTSEESFQVIHYLVRKAAHFTEYAVMGFFVARAFSTSSHRLLKRQWLLFGLGFVTLYALLDEYHQSFVASRTASIYDSIIDMAGGLMALLLYRQRTRHSS